MQSLGRCPRVPKQSASARLETHPGRILFAYFCTFIYPKNDPIEQFLHEEHDSDVILEFWSIEMTIQGRLNVSIPA